MSSKLLTIGLEQSDIEALEHELDGWTVVPASVDEVAGDYELGVVGGFPKRQQTLAMCDEIRSRDEALPLLVVLDRWEAPQVQYVLAVGGTRCLIRPYNAERLQRAVDEVTSPDYEAPSFG